MLGDCSERWSRLGPHIATAAALARLVGLDAPPSDQEDERGRARRTLLHALTLVLGVVKRTCVPADPDKSVNILLLLFNHINVSIISESIYCRLLLEYLMSIKIVYCCKCDDNFSYNNKNTITSCPS